MKKVLTKYKSLGSEILPLQQTKETKLLLNEIEKIKSDENVEYILKDIDSLITETQSGTVRIKNIIKNLRSFAHIDTSEKQKVNINNELETTLKIAHNELKYKCNIHKKFGKIPNITCYPGELNQVFLNLLVNAAQAIEKQGDITIETENRDNKIIIKITDTGIGISKKNLDKVFDPFFYYKRSRERDWIGAFSKSWNNRKTQWYNKRRQ